MGDIRRRRADARSLVLTDSLARRVEQLRREAEAFFAEHPPDPDGWRPTRSMVHPETIQASHYVAVLARIPKIERAMDRRRYSAALDLYEMAESWAEAARTARRAERTGEVYEEAFRERRRLARARKNFESGAGPIAGHLATRADLRKEIIDRARELLGVSPALRHNRVATMLRRELERKHAEHVPAIRTIRRYLDEGLPKKK